MIREKHLKLLRPYLVGEQPRDNGEWDMHCPLHVDGKRSAQINVENGLWNCHAGCGGGRVIDLIRQRSQWVDPSAAKLNGQHAPDNDEAPSISNAQVGIWHEALYEDEHALDELMEERGLEEEIIDQYELGWDERQRAYTIPVRAPDETIWNVRRYQLKVPEGRRKIWSHGKGFGAPKLYPMSILEDDPRSIIICEGELDALITIQNGYAAITRTGAAKVWEAEWGQHFKGRVVYLAHDCDTAGQDGNKKVGRALKHIAKDIRVLKLPYEIKEKHGEDLTDFWMEHDSDDFKELLANAEPFEPVEPEELDPSDAGVLDALDSRKVGTPLRLTVTIKGKRDPGYSVPEHVKYSCTRDAGNKCSVCPMNAAGGEAELDIPRFDPVVLAMMDSSNLQLHDILREYYGALKCNKLSIESESHQGVEVLFARSSIDHVGGGAADFKNITLTSVGRHDTRPNNTVEVIGALQPDPRRQTNAFQAWEVNHLETSLDHFEMDKTALKLMKRFQPRAKERPLKRLKSIAEELADHVTHIYGLPEMHALMDLAFHSLSSFCFGGKLIQRGWLDVLVIGDTRTGKSEAADKLTRHYNAGEIVNCEAASFAGIFGGAQQFGGNKEWSITWGAIPLNDRRLVVMDEVSGLLPEDIAKLSDVRSRGVAQLTKIQTEAALARTRMIWCGNPRNGRMSDFTYGVQAIAPLIGNVEDIARFDLAMSVQAGDVPSSEINRARAEGELRYTTEAASALLRWAWSRTPDQVKWAKGAEDAVYRYAEELGKLYVEDPPLVQAANVREKIARVAVALAARLFSTDKTFERVIVRREHVRDAVEFMNHLYNMRGFGYAERSRELIADMDEAEERRGDIKLYLYEKRALAKFLRNTSKFRRQDLEEIMDINKEESNAIIAKLWEARMVRKDRGDIRVEPALHELLREVNIR